MSAAAQQKPQLIVKLSVVKGPHAGQVFQLSKDHISIGRGPENDVVLLNDPQISRAHAQLILVDRDFEIVNQSKKNAVFVNGENIERWKLINHETFIIGDSEFKIEYDLGLAVAVVPAKKIAPIVPIKLKPEPPIPPVALSPKTPIQNQVMKKGAVSARAAPRPGAPMTARPNPAQPRMATGSASESIFNNSRVLLYGGVVILAIALYAFTMGSGKGASKKAKSILKYEDEIAIKLNSTNEKEQIEKRNELAKAKNSPQKQRADENFIKGMRDFHLGNYSRAMDFYQVVLNLQPDHALARRHLYLSKVRFDELVQTKLMLGESYYKKHNFSMCESLYRQVMDMLGDKKTDDPKYKLAESKTKECRLAAEGIR